MWAQNATRPRTDASTTEQTPLHVGREVGVWHRICIASFKVALIAKRQVHCVRHAHATTKRQCTTVRQDNVRSRLGTGDKCIAGQTPRQGVTGT